MQDGHNLKETKKMSTSHAEIIAINKASKKLDNWRLADCDMYVTLEPCIMCAGALLSGRIRKVYIGTMDKAYGACGSSLNIEEHAINHKIEIETGILKEDCEYILKKFFKKLRKRK